MATEEVVVVVGGVEGEGGGGERGSGDPKKLQTICDMWNHSQCVCSRKENTCRLEKTHQNTQSTSSNSVPSKNPTPKVTNKM